MYQLAGGNGIVNWKAHQTNNQLKYYTRKNAWFHSKEIMIGLVIHLVVLHRYDSWSNITLLIYLQLLLIKGAFLSIVPIVQNQWLTDLLSSNSNILMKKNAILCICKHHLLHAGMYFLLHTYICICCFFCHGTNLMPICKKCSWCMVFPITDPIICATLPSCNLTCGKVALSSIQCGFLTSQ